MHRLLFVPIVAILALGALFLATTLTGSDGVAQADGNGAVVIDDVSCLLFDGDGGTAPGTAHAVTTPSKNGNVVVKCSAKGVDNSTGKAVQYDTDDNPWGAGTACTWMGPSTLDWKETVSASGNATLTCLFP